MLFQIDYVKEGDVWNMMARSSADVWKNNLETIIQWSPYYSEADLLQQVNQSRLLREQVDGRQLNGDICGFHAYSNFFLLVGIFFICCHTVWCIT